MQTWLIAAIVSAVFGCLFAFQLDAFLSAQDQLSRSDHPVGLSGFMAVRYMEPLSLLFSIIAPLFAMRSFSSEFRQETFVLWQSAPVSGITLVTGKFFGLMMVLSALAILASSLLLLMRIFVPIDAPLISSALLGLLLCTAMSTACGLYFSSLTKQALVAVTGSLALIILLWMLGSVSSQSMSIEWAQSLSVANHLRGFFQGYIKSNDIAYFLLLTGLFLSLTIVQIDSLRYRSHKS